MNAIKNLIIFSLFASMTMACGASSQSSVNSMASVGVSPAAEETFRTMQAEQTIETLAVESTAQTNGLVADELLDTQASAQTVSLRLPAISQPVVTKPVVRKPCRKISCGFSVPSVERPAIHHGFSTSAMGGGSGLSGIATPGAMNQGF